MLFLSTTDTYVKVSFLQHNKTFKCKKTSIVKQSPNPVYNESFTFKASALETASVVIHLMQATSGHGKGKLFLKNWKYTFFAFHNFNILTILHKSSLFFNLLRCRYWTSSTWFLHVCSRQGSRTLE